MRYFLIQQTKYFIDPNGEPDLGGVNRFVSTDDKWSEYLNQEDEDEVTEWEGSNNGCNIEYNVYEAKELTGKEYERAKFIIETYEKIFKLF